MALRVASTRCWPQACSTTTPTLATTAKYPSESQLPQGKLRATLSKGCASIPKATSTLQAHMVSDTTAANRVARSGCWRLRRAHSSSVKINKAKNTALDRVSVSPQLQALSSKNISCKPPNAKAQASAIAQPIGRRNTTQASSGTINTFKPVINALRLLLISAKPSVCNQKAMKLSSPSTSPQRHSAPRSRTNSGSNTTLAKPKRRAKMCNAGTSLASNFMAGKVVPHTKVTPSKASTPA